MPSWPSGPPSWSSWAPKVTPGGSLEPAKTRKAARGGSIREASTRKVVRRRVDGLSRHPRIDFSSFFACRAQAPKYDPYRFLRCIIDVARVSLCAPRRSEERRKTPCFSIQNRALGRPGWPFRASQGAQVAQQVAPAARQVAKVDRARSIGRSHRSSEPGRSSQVAQQVAHVERVFSARFSW